MIYNVSRQWVNCKLGSVQFKMSSWWYLNVSMCSETPIYNYYALFETVPVFIWLILMIVALSPAFKEDYQALPLSTPLSSEQSMIQCPWLHACRYCIRLLSTSDLTRHKPPVTIALSASLSAQSFSFTAACPVQYRSYQRSQGGCQPWTHASMGLPFQLT